MASRAAASSAMASWAFSATVRASVSGSGSLIASTRSEATTGCALAAVATVTSPAPARIAARAHSAAAPVLPTEPATTRRWPYVPLWLSRGRRGNSGATSARSSRNVMISRVSSAAGTPISTTSTRPASSTPAPTTSPTLRAANVGVSQACTTGPAGGSPSAGNPEGMSSATTGRPPALIASMSAAISGAGVPCVPVPSSASTTTSLCPSVEARPLASSTRRAAIPARRISRYFSAASPASVSGGTARWTTGRAPASFKRRATTKPSPPLPPLPQTSATRRPRARRPRAGSARSSASAAPRPAFSMRVAPGMPSSPMARASSRRICAAVNTGCTSAASRERDGLGDEVGDDGRVQLAVLDPRRLRQLDVQRTLGQLENAIPLGAGGGVEHGIRRLDGDFQARRARLPPQMRVAHELRQRAQALRVLLVDTDGGDLDAAGRLETVVAVDLGVEAQRPLRDLPHAPLVRVVDPAGPLAAGVLRRRAARRSLERAVHLIAAAGPLAPFDLALEAGGHHEPEAGATRHLGGDLGGPHVGGAVRGGHHEPGTSGTRGDLTAPRVQRMVHALGGAADEDERGGRHPSEEAQRRTAHGPPAWSGRAHSRRRA